MRQINYRIEKESWEQQREAGRYNPASVIKVKGKQFTIGAGDSDHVTVYQEGEEVIVLSTNYRLGYAGIEIFNLANGGQVGEVFVQSEDELKDMVGRKGLDYSERTLAKRLTQYIY